MFVFETNYGSFTVELDFANAPISSKISRITLNPVFTMEPSFIE